MLVLKLCGNQRVDGVGRLRFDVRTGLKADEAEWKKRDVHTRHETATLEIGKAVAWHYAPVGKPGELQCGNQPVRQAGLEVLFIILAASMQHESAWRPRTRRLRLIHPNV